MKNTAAIYLPIQTNAKEIYDHEVASSTKNTLSGALQQAGLHRNNFNLNSISKNLTIQATTEFAQKYAVGAITKILNGEPVTNKTMLDSLFNTYAPALNGGLLQSGYNSIMAMKDAALHGTINAANFLSGLSMGLEAMAAKNTSFSYKNKYSEEIPIDIVERCTFKYKTVVPEHAKAENNNDTSYIGNMQRTVINLFGHVKNKNAEIWELNDFSYKIADAMAMKKMVALRIGRTIYEDVIIVNYEPVIENIYDIKFQIEFYMAYKKNQGSMPYDDNKKVRIVPNNLSRELKNLLAEQEYIGQGLVEKVTKDDIDIINQAKKLLGKDKILIDGEYI